MMIIFRQTLWAQLDGQCITGAVTSVEFILLITPITRLIRYGNITKLLVNDYKQLRVNKYVFQALYQMLQTTKMNFEDWKAN